MDLESELSDLSDLSDLDLGDLEGFPTPLSTAACPPSPAKTSFPMADCFPQFLHPSASKPPLAEYANPSPSEPACGKKARRKRKTQVNYAKRNVKRKLSQEALGTALKGVARKRAAQSKTAGVGEAFSTEELPVNQGSWSGLRKQLDKVLPELEEALGEELDMRLVNWEGR